MTAAVTKIDGINETVNKIFELVCKRNPIQDLNLNADFGFAKDINSNLRTVCDLFTDLEGVKLDAGLTETKLCNNIHTNLENIKRQFFCMSRNFDKKCLKPQIFLAYHLYSLCFSFILYFID